MSEEMKTFDVTTSEARKNALKQAVAESLLYAFIPGIGAVVAFWRLKKLTTLYSRESQSQEIESQRETAIEIIRAGKDHSVDEIEITMSEKAGLSLGSSIEGFPIECTIGTSGTMTIKVKYK